MILNIYVKFNTWLAQVTDPRQTSIHLLLPSDLKQTLIEAISFEHM